MSKSKLWRYSTGDKGVNRVTVYQRNLSPRLYIEWWDDDGRHQRSLTTATGVPIVDRNLAKRLAHRASAAQLRKRKQQASALLGVAQDRTLADLLRVYHDDMKDSWKPSHMKKQEMFRRFWLTQLGHATALTDITGPTCNRVVRDHVAEQKKKWSPTTQNHYLRYIVDAYSYARKFLKWIGEQHDLSNVRYVKAYPVSRAYSLEETRLLLAALHEVDLRAGVLGELCYYGGRRLASVLAVETPDVYLVPESVLEELDGINCAVVITFLAEHDKASQRGRSVFVNDTARAIKVLLDTPLVKSTKFLFPLGDLDKPTPRSETAPPHQNYAIKRWLAPAEKLAGIEHVKGRAFHGLKRRFATDVDDLTTASWQSGTSEATLRRTYRQDDLLKKLRLAEQLSHVAQRR